MKRSGLELASSVLLVWWCLYKDYTGVEEQGIGIQASKCHGFKLLTRPTSALLHSLTQTPMHKTTPI